MEYKNSNNEQIITCVTLLAATVCNLQCEYCVIANYAKKYKNLKSIHDASIAALEDGSYLANVKKAMKNMHQSRNNVNNLQIWGQEPTMILSHLTAHLEDWLVAFPNLNYFFFSTNGMEHVDDVYEFIVKLDSLIHSQFTFELQLSYDGSFGENNVRGGNNETIKKNFKWLNEKLNVTKLRHIHVKINPHGVMSYSLAKYLVESPEHLDAFVNDVDDFIKCTMETSISKNVEWNAIGFQYQNGTPASSEEGIIYSELIYKMELRQNQKRNLYFEFSPGFRYEIGGASPVVAINNGRNLGVSSVGDIVDNIAKGWNYCENNSQFCGSIHNDLKIRYDGTVMLCQNYIYERDKDYQNLDHSIDDEARPRFIKATNGVNFADESKHEEMEKSRNFVKMYKEKPCMQSLINQICNLMFLMASCGQISPDYLEDLDKLKRHAYLVSLHLGCYANNLSLAGAPSLVNTSIIRLLCNGILDKQDEAVEKCLVDPKAPFMWNKHDVYSEKLEDLRG